MFDIQKKTGLTVYLYYNRDVRKLSKFGNIFYHSKRLRYAILYVDDSQVKTVTKHLEQQRFIKAVEPSQLDHIDQDFVGNLYR
ncbi:DUF2129 domain-containing protein [Streptococcus fryi]